jgi:isopentenyldiphosphate isomerase
MSYLDRIAECNRHDLTGFLPFTVAGTRVGHVSHRFASVVGAQDDAFIVTGDGVALAGGLDDYAARTKAVDAALRRLREAGEIPEWCDEPYPVGTDFHAPSYFQIERAAASRFGIRSYGIHINAFVRKADGIHMWIARRAHDKTTYPGMLDNAIAGGQPVGIGLMENVIKESREEADVPEALAACAVPIGAVSYTMQEGEKMMPDVLFNYDLELPEDFTPRNTDGEVSEFMLLPVAEVMRLTEQTTEFKFNCALVNIDFFIRHGLVGPEHPDYLAIQAGLRK